MGTAHGGPETPLPGSTLAPDVFMKRNLFNELIEGIEAMRRARLDICNRCNEPWERSACEHCALIYVESPIVEVIDGDRDVDRGTG
jgi:hypothetical protein